MNWRNVKLILAREIRDQLRDRRTLFMIAVLPILLYPLLGMSFFQVTQFMSEHPIRVLVVGAPDIPQLPPLVKKDRFAANLFSEGETGDLLHVTSKPSIGDGQAAALDLLDLARDEMREAGYDMVISFPPDFAERFARFRQALASVRSGKASLDDAELKLPGVGIYPNLSQDASKAAYRRVADVLGNWREQIGRHNLEANGVPPVAANPFRINTQDVAEEGQHTAAVWSKILPFVLLIWALTGAFYPAIDLCAGEKERGTLETLLCSPAERLEIVWGKLLTVMLFSMATAILNLASLGITGSLVLNHLPNLGPPPTLAIVWLLLALLPV
ncbi:MAG: ABC transporter permease subunit, partial [Pirellulales bacterium]